MLVHDNCRELVAMVTIKQTLLSITVFEREFASCVGVSAHRHRNKLTAIQYRKYRTNNESLSVFCLYGIRVCEVYLAEAISWLKCISEGKVHTITRHEGKET